MKKTLFMLGLFFYINANFGMGNDQYIYTGAEHNYYSDNFEDNYNKKRSCVRSWFWRAIGAGISLGTAVALEALVFNHFEGVSSTVLLGGMAVGIATGAASCCLVRSCELASDLIALQCCKKRRSIESDDESDEENPYQSSNENYYNKTTNNSIYKS